MPHPAGGGSPDEPPREVNSIAAGWCTEPMEIGSASGAVSVPASARSIHVTAADAVIDIGCASAVAAHSTNNKAAHPRIVSLPRAGLPAVRAFRALGCATGSADERESVDFDQVALQAVGRSLTALDNLLVVLVLRDGRD